MGIVSGLYRKNGKEMETTIVSLGIGVIARQ